MKQIKIAVDGPSGAGKSTISKIMSNNFNLVYIDTGAMYRAVGLKALRLGIDTKNDINKINNMIEDIEVSLEHKDHKQLVILDGEDVTGLIRTPEVSIAASNVSAILSVREKMVELQRKLAQKCSVIMDGRDIGSNVLPDADLKIFLTASLDARAKRRYNELVITKPEITFDEVKKDMEYRDKNDSTRDIAPLVVANGAVVVDTSDRTFQQSVELLENIIKEKINVL